MFIQCVQYVTGPLYIGTPRSGGGGGGGAGRVERARPHGAERSHNSVARGLTRTITRQPQPQRKSVRVHVYVPVRVCRAVSCEAEICHVSTAMIF